MPVSLELGATGLLIGLVIALPVGIYSAVRQDTLGDYAGRSVAIFGLATPNFWLGLMVLIFPGICWGWAPPLRLYPFSEDPLAHIGMFIIPGLIAVRLPRPEDPVPVTDGAGTTGNATTTIASAAGSRRRSPWAEFARRLVREKPLGLDVLRVLYSPHT